MSGISLLQVTSRNGVIAAVLLLVGCGPTGSAFVEAVNQKYPVQSKQVIVSNAKINQSPVDASKPPVIKLGDSILFQAEVESEEWGLSLLGEFWDETPSISHRPAPNTAHRIFALMAFIRSPSEMANPIVEKPSIAMFRFKPGGTSGEVKASFTSPKKPGTYTLEVFAFDTSEHATTPEKKIVAIYRTAVRVQ